MSRAQVRRIRWIGRPKRGRRGYVSKAKANRLGYQPAGIRAFLFGLAVAGCGWLCSCAEKAAVGEKLLFSVLLFGNLAGCVVVN
jgi:hypothetical protein